jgi:hypothetical protein
MDESTPLAEGEVVGPNPTGGVKTVLGEHQSVEARLGCSRVGQTEISLRKRRT